MRNVALALSIALGARILQAQDIVQDIPLSGVPTGLPTALTYWSEEALFLYAGQVWESSERGGWLQPNLLRLTSAGAATSVGTMDYRVKGLAFDTGETTLYTVTPDDAVLRETEPTVNGSPTALACSDPLQP